jgi:glutamate decarboxylase
MTNLSDPNSDAALFGNRFGTKEVPSREFPETGMTAVDAMRLVGEDLALEGDPARNLATFVTTWMEPEAQRIIAGNLHRNFIDHAEYPAHGRDRAAMHPNAQRPLPRPRHDEDRGPHPGLV